MLVRHRLVRIPASPTMAGSGCDWSSQLAESVQGNGSVARPGRLRVNDEAKFVVCHINLANVNSPHATVRADVAVHLVGYRRSEFPDDVLKTAICQVGFLCGVHATHPPLVRCGCQVHLGCSMVSCNPPTTVTSSADYGDRSEQQQSQREMVVLLVKTLDAEG